MTLDAGTKLGRYEIHAKIGAGGMGEVSRGAFTPLPACALEIFFVTLPGAHAPGSTLPPASQAEHYERNHFP